MSQCYLAYSVHSSMLSILREIKENEKLTSTFRKTYSLIRAIGEAGIITSRIVAVVSDKCQYNLKFRNQAPLRSHTTWFETNSACPWQIT